MSPRYSTALCPGVMACCGVGRSSSNSSSDVALASASNQTVHARIFSYHALWHVVGAFGFVLLWGFNQARFVAPRPG